MKRGRRSHGTFDANLSFRRTVERFRSASFLLIERPPCSYRGREICWQFLEFEIDAWAEGKASRYPGRVAIVRLIWIIGYNEELSVFRGNVCFCKNFIHLDENLLPFVKSFNYLGIFIFIDQKINIFKLVFLMRLLKSQLGEMFSLHDDLYLWVV